MPTDSEITRAAEILRAGGLVAFPTETVYGLGAHALDERAVARIFEVKSRPRFDPLIVHVASREAIARLVTEWPAQAQRLAERFWPGPLTLVLPKAPFVPDLVTAGCSTVAVRIPDHPVAQALLRAADVPVAAPSANPFGRISPTTAAHVREQLGDRIDLILDGGPCRVGVESTVLQLTADGPLLLRPGGTTVEEIEELIGPVRIAAPADVVPASGLASPGALPTHYAPRTPLALRDESLGAGVYRSGGDMETGTEGIPHVPRCLPFSPSSCLAAVAAVLATSNPHSRLGLLTLRAPTSSAGFARIETLSSTGDLREATANFFAALRRLDAAGLDLIVADLFPETGLGRALNDRLRRAAHS